MWYWISYSGIVIFMSIEGCGEKGVKFDEILGVEGEEWMYFIFNLELFECLYFCREFMVGKL